MSVFIDGSTLSSLLYSHSNSAGNQEGLLLGEVIDHVKDHISDSQINNSQVQTCMYVSSHIPWPSEERVYSRGGVPIMEKLAALLGDSHGREEVIGWYSFRRNSTLRMSMKERTLHKHLEARFCPHKPDHFLFFMCVDTVSTECSTHSLEHFFVTVAKGSGAVKKISMTVSNLGDTLHTQYKTLANVGVTRSAAVKNILHNFQSQFVSSSQEMAEVKRIDDLSSTLNSDLLKLCQQVAESEKKAGELEQEVQQMKEELSRREEQQREAQRLKKEAEKKKEPEGLYPTLPEGAGGYELGQERLVVDLGQGSNEKRQKPSSIDDLLSHSTTSNPCDNQGSSDACLRPVISSTLEEPPPPAPTVTSADSCEPRATVLQSVVDTITDTDEDEGQGAGNNSKVPVSHATKVPAEESVSLNNTSKAHGDGASKSGVSGALGGSGKSQDHFAFVDNLITSETGTSNKKTATVPTGATLTYSPRTTRSQLKGGTGPAAKEQSKPQNMKESTRTALNLDVTASTKANETASKVGLSASVPSLGNSSLPSANRQTKSDVQSRGTHDKTNSDSSKQGHSGVDSSVRLKLDPNKFDLEGRQRSRSQVTNSSSNRGARNDTEHERASSGSRQNGNNSNIQDVDKNMCRSSSPIF